MVAKKTADQPIDFSKSISLETLIEQLSNDLHPEVINKVINNLAELGLMKRETVNGREFVVYSEQSLATYPKYYLFISKVIEIDEQIEQSILRQPKKAG